MQMTADAVKEIITAIGFIPQNGKRDVYHKVYASHSGYSVFVDFNSRKIVYDADSNPQNICIKVGDRTTSNFSQAENFVVLECVNRLLEKGYPPSCIELEKTYPSGRGHSGRLDIFVKCTDGTPFLMIECKTWGLEFEREKNRTLKSGGQLFSYYSSERGVKYLCLYSSRVEERAEYRNLVIDVDEDWKALSGEKEIFEYWNKNFRDNGIFDSYAAPYDIRHKALTYRGLENLKESDGGKIFNQIMEILRHNAISDKPNAFNKLLNLFVCKIIDEDKNADDEMEFQWLETDTDESLQMRLNDLYKEGMWRFLEIDIIDYKQEEVAEKLNNLNADSETRRWLMQMYTDTRLKKSPNFAFVEVQDDKTFALNAKVVREIVKLLQIYKFRYEQKHEFLGSFFELLLDTSMKQEAGQFFTPVPIARFVISSLPLRELVQRRVDERNGEPLPTVIDYACGSGHFLTEYMSHLQEIIDSGIRLDNATPSIKRQFQAWQGLTKFTWAKDYVYGIDLDNRLVKTAKVSAFFNGDGEAAIVWANGLDNFEKSETFRGKLKKAHGRDNENFDILISNPPYSVDAFKSTIHFGEESFELYPFITDNSSEIECLFVERMKHLLKVGGWGAVLLPSSILTNGGIYARTREILLRYFRVKAIVELGSNTFMKTNTSTVILFLERRSDNDFIVIQKAVEEFFSAKIDVAAAGMEHAFSTFVSNAYEGISFADYVSLLMQNPTEAMKKHELYVDYKKVFGDGFYEKAAAVEKDKLLCFLLTKDQTVALIKAGEKRQEKQFLGYEFRGRRGHEGMHWLPGGTKLYHESEPLCPDTASSYIYHAFLNEQVEVADSMAQYVSYGCMSDLLEYGTNKFDRVINLGRKIKLDSAYPAESLESLVHIISGVTYGKNDQIYDESGQVVLTADNISNAGMLQIVKQIYLRQELVLDENRKLRKDDIFICLSSGSRKHVGKCALIDRDTPCYAGGFMGILRRKQKNLLMKYLWAVLSSQDYRLLMGQSSTGANINNLGSRIGEIKVPVPPMSIQQQIAAELEALETERMDIETAIKRYQRDGEYLYGTIDLSNTMRVGDCAKAEGGKRLSVGENFSAEKTAFPYIRVSDFKNNSVEMSGLQYISEAQRERIKRYVIHSSDIYISIAGTIGLVGIIPDTLDGANLTENAAKLIPDISRINQMFMMYMLDSDFVQKQIQDAVVGLGTPKLSLDRIRQLQIPVPPMREQEKFAAEMNRIRAEIDRLNLELKQMRAARDDVLKKYLSRPEKFINP